MDPQLLAVLREITTTLQTIAHDMHWWFTLNLWIALTTLMALCLVWWRLSLRLDARHDEGRKALADLHATSQAIVAQTAEVLRRTPPQEG